jgi:hypothetical protein
VIVTCVRASSCRSVEEHQLLTSSTSGLNHRASSSSHGGNGGTAAAGGGGGAITGTRVVSSRKVFRHAIADLCCLPVAQRLVARNADGSVMVRMEAVVQLRALHCAVHCEPGCGGRSITKA